MCILEARGPEQQLFLVRRIAKSRKLRFTAKFRMYFRSLGVPKISVSRERGSNIEKTRCSETDEKSRFDRPFGMHVAGLRQENKDVHRQMRKA